MDSKKRNSRPNIYLSLFVPLQLYLMTILNVFISTHNYKHPTIISPIWSANFKKEAPVLNIPILWYAG